MTVGEICTITVVSVSAHRTIPEAAALMRDRHVGNLVVCDASFRPIGILTDRDIVVSAVAQSPDRINELAVGDVMTRDISIVGGGTSIDDALQLMRRRGVRRLPVVAPDGTLAGILALDDVLRVIAREMSELEDVMAREQVREHFARP